MTCGSQAVDSSLGRVSLRQALKLTLLLIPLLLNSVIPHEVPANDAGLPEVELVPGARDVQINMCFEGDVFMIADCRHSEDFFLGLSHRTVFYS